MVAVPTGSPGEYALNCLGPARAPGKENTNAWLTLVLDDDGNLRSALASDPEKDSPWQWRLDDDPDVDAVNAVTIFNVLKKTYLLGDTVDSQR